jgi:hypothetical protein
MPNQLQVFGPYFANTLGDDGSTEIPVRPGIYLWRRVFQEPPTTGTDANAALSWVKQRLEAPLARYQQLRISADADSSKLAIRSHFVTLGDLRVGAARLDTEELMPPDEQSRKMLLRQVFQLSQIFGPILYVGEASNLRARIQQHLQGQTGLAERLQECGTSIDDLAVFYVPTDELPARDRQRLELLLTHLTGAPLSIKAGK